MHSWLPDGVHEDPDIKFIINSKILSISFAVQPGLHIPLADYRYNFHGQARLEKTFRTGRHGIKVIVRRDDAAAGTVTAGITTTIK